MVRVYPETRLININQFFIENELLNLLLGIFFVRDFCIAVKFNIFT
ncbi:hypothetical protein GYO_0735 [Bacillus spizizenii TU-B-10]|uniref:Uncharacterized protein n=1 Tax=Bacillus spizizenii (strain DSM 15029 / JCM 12233 / NBRC 101239 / NRRL B-23049 / TU-B-10) TaxID=1052585 RepID=G4NW93_BACS4|nr:hypothetical protein GYO_0735 [Bacillus spizizenii TU-B-10]